MCKADVDFTLSPTRQDMSFLPILPMVQHYHNQDEAIKDADFIYVKNWSAYEPYGAVFAGNEDWMLTNAQA
jgi:N-succinyl-L-ornithine transcarbamylase